MWSFGKITSLNIQWKQWKREASSFLWSYTVYTPSTALKAKIAYEIIQKEQTFCLF